MKPLGWSLVLAGALQGCAPAPLQAQPNAQLRVEARVATPPLSTVTGEQLYRAPGPGALLVRTDRSAYLTSLFVPASGGVSVLPVGQVRANETVTVSLPSSLGFTQVFTVASLTPLNLASAQGARSLAEAGRAVQAATREQPAGSYTVATSTYTVGRFGTLRITAPVPGAQVRVGTTLVGSTPLTLPDVPVGPMTVSVFHSGYTTFSQRVNVQPDTTTEIRAALQLIVGTLQVQSDVPADVVVDRQLVGRVNAAPLKVALRPGVAGLNIVPLNRAFKPQNLLVRITAHRQTELICALGAGEYSCRAP